VVLKVVVFFVVFRGEFSIFCSTKKPISYFTINLMSKLISEGSNFVVIGAWNPAIIQPAWLKKQFQNLIPDKVIVKGTAGLVSLLNFDLEKIILDPNGGRLLFIPKIVDEETLKYITELSNGIYDRLKHTPISAAGCNFSFALEENENFSLDEIDKDDQIVGLYAFLKGNQLVSKSVRHSFSTEDHTININYDYRGKNKVLRINYDYQAPLNPMQKAADALINNFMHAKDLSANLIRSK